MTYGAETWSLRMDEGHTLDVIEMQRFRNMFGVTRMVRRRYMRK